MKYTTTNLRLDARHWWLLHERQIRDVSIGGMFATALMLIYTLLHPAVPPKPVVIREQMRPAILIQTAAPLPTLPPQPTATPWPTPEPVIVIQQIEVPVQSAPEVVYVPVQAPADAAPTAEPPPPPLAPQTQAILDRGAWASAAATAQAGR